MSFSGMVKEELSRHIGSGRHCRIAELAGDFYFLRQPGVGTRWKKNPQASRQKMRHLQEKALHYCKKHLI